MYLLYCAIIFGVVAIPKRHRFEWSVLAVFMALLWCNKELLDRNGDALYITRASLAFVGAMLLLLPKSLIGYYQSVILLGILAAYGLLAYDVATREYSLIYDNYETITYGLVICQLIGILPSIWNSYCDRYPSHGLAGRYLQGNTRT